MTAIYALMHITAVRSNHTCVHKWRDKYSGNNKNTAHETFIYWLVSSKIEKHFPYMENIWKMLTFVSHDITTIRCYSKITREDKLT